MKRTYAALAALVFSAACAAPARENAAADSTAAPAPAQAAAPAPAQPAELAQAPAGTPTVVVYKTPTCGCCAAWVDRMREAGFTMEVHDMDDVSPVKQQQRVPLHLNSCHTAIVGGYALEGHVPPQTVLRLLRERPQVKGIAVGGMPAGSPGMEMGGRKDPFEVVAWTEAGETRVYEAH